MGQRPDRRRGGTVRDGSGRHGGTDPTAGTTAGPEARGLEQQQRCGSRRSAHHDRQAAGAHRHQTTGEHGAISYRNGSDWAKARKFFNKRPAAARKNKCGLYLYDKASI